MNRSRDYYRKQRARVIRRKQNIIHSQNDYWHVEHAGMLSKGKIHCSCPMCRHKSYDEKCPTSGRMSLPGSSWRSSPAIRLRICSASPNPESRPERGGSCFLCQNESRQTCIE